MHPLVLLSINTSFTHPKDKIGIPTFKKMDYVIMLSFSSCGATMEAVAGMLLHSTALRPVSCTGPMRIPGVCVCV